ncbi:hypothetical protein ACLI4Y_09970 [Natrialbaceae archaeon A-CW3]
MFGAGIGDRTATRGDAPLVGIVLLFGMVFVGAAIVGVSGMMLLDSLEGQSEVENARMSMDETTLRLNTVTETGTQQTVSDATVTSDGSVSIAWYDAGAGASSPFEDDTCLAHVDDFGAVVEGVDDRTIAYQGGGVWERTEADTTIRSPPPLTYEDGSLEFGLVTVSSESVESGESVVQYDPEGTTNLSAKLETAGEDPACDSHPDFALKIQSTYYQGWHTHLENEFGDVANATVDVNHDEEYVVVALENARTTAPVFDVDVAVEPITSFNDGLSATATVTNVGTASGSDTVAFTIEGATESKSTATLEPGEETTLDFSLNQNELWDALGVGPGQPNDIEHYDEYSYDVTTGDAAVEGAFFYSFHHTFYHQTDVGHTHDENVTTVTADLTNIGNESEAREVTIELESDIDELGDPLTYTESIQGDPWEDTTVEVDFNRSALPDGEYTYTVAVNNSPEAPCNQNDGACEQNGTFEIRNGAVGDVDEIIVTEPSDVEVSILGTEISGEWWSGGEYRKNWAPVTASAVIGETRYRFLPNGETEEIPLDQPHYTEPGAQMEDYNLNTYGTQTQTYDIETEIESGSVTIEATYWPCAQGGLTHVATDEAKDGETTHHYSCNAFAYGEEITVEGGGAGDASTEHGLMMTRTADANHMPDIEKGFPLQRSINDVFQDGTDDVELIDNELQLEEGDFAFMMETTMTQSALQSEFPDYPWETVDTSDQSEMNRAAWDIAANYRDTDVGDPNFNDIIGFVQVGSGASYVDFDDPKQDFRVDGEKRRPSQSGTEPESVGDGSAVSVETDAIVIS